MIQEARPWLVDFHVAAALDSFPVFWVLLLGLFLVVSASGDLSFALGFSWCFLRLEIFIFLLGLLKMFRKFLCQGLERPMCDWAGQLGSCVFFLFFSCPTDPSARCWARGGPFC